MTPEACISALLQAAIAAHGAVDGNVPRSTQVLRDYSLRIEAECFHDVSSVLMDVLAELEKRIPACEPCPLPAPCESTEEAWEFGRKAGRLEAWRCLTPGSWVEQGGAIVCDLENGEE